MGEPLHIVDYDPRWPHLFAQERRRLAGAFTPPGVGIVHVGSTAVPGLAAKPVLDILVGVERLSEAEAAIPALEALGYRYVPEYERELPERRYFRKPRARPRTHHLHCVVKGSAFWADHLLFRDYLRAHPETAAAYADLKRSLASRLGRGTAYTEGKSPFIEEVLRRARRELDR